MYSRINPSITADCFLITHHRAVSRETAEIPEPVLPYLGVALGPGASSSSESSVIALSRLLNKPEISEIIGLN